MGFQTRWGFILDKAKKESKKEEEDLLLAWAERIARAHKNFRVDLGPEETQRLAEIDWWKHLFLDEPFPESPQEWQQDASSNLSKDTSSAGSTPLQSSPSRVTVSRGVGATYTSCWETIKLKALDARMPLDETMEDYRASVAQALREYLRDYGHAVSMFRAELHLWRDLFPEEYFPGINPVTGERNLITGADLDLCRSHTEEKLDETTQTNQEAGDRNPSTSNHPEQGISSADDWQLSESIGDQQKGCGESLSQGREFAKTDKTDEKENYRPEQRSRSRSPDACPSRPEVRQRTPLKQSLNKPIPVAPITRQATAYRSPFPFRGDSVNIRGSAQVMCGGFQNRGAFNNRGASPMMRGGPQNVRGLTFRGGRGSVPWTRGGFQHNRGTAHQFRGGMQNTTGSPQNFRGSFQN